MLTATAAAKQIQREGQSEALKRDRDPPKPPASPQTLCFACKHRWPYNTQWTSSVPLSLVRTCFDCYCHKWLKKTKVSSLGIKNPRDILASCGIAQRSTHGENTVRVRSSIPTWVCFAGDVFTCSALKTADKSSLQTDVHCWRARVPMLTGSKSHFLVQKALQQDRKCGCNTKLKFFDCSKYLEITAILTDPIFKSSIYS